MGGRVMILLIGGVEVILDLVQNFFVKSENMEEMSNLDFLEDESDFANNLFERWQGFVSKFK
jgi:hypothetical protein